MSAGPVYHEDWFGENSCKALAGLVERVVFHEPEVLGDIVELGSWEGRSTAVIDEAANRTDCIPWHRTVHAVDTWRGSPGEPSEQLAAERDVYAQFVANMAAEYRTDRVVPHVQDWREFARCFGQRCALVFIDIEHTYEQTRDAIEAFRWRMSPGGIICGDDIHHPPVQQAVIDTLGDTSWEASVWWWQNP